MIYLLAGHTVVNGRGTGAFGVDGFDEAVEAAKLRDDITKLLRSRGVAVTNDVNTTPLAKVVAWLKSIVKKDDKVIEIHFNAGQPAATGAECFVASKSTYEENILSGKIVKVICQILGIRNRGVKAEFESQHKTLAIVSVPSAAVNVLVEVCFLSNKNDVALYRKHYNELVEALANAIV
jgi:N-acetylmuramoyl-L-alanine amidase